MKKILLSLPFLSLALWLGSCDKNPNKMCTELYAMYIASVVDSNQQAVVLTDSWTQIKSTGEKLTVSTDSSNRAKGNYILLTDSHMGKVSEQGTELQFIGMKDTSKIVDVTYIFKHDGCHIQKVSGPDKIEVN